MGPFQSGSMRAGIHSPYNQSRSLGKTTERGGSAKGRWSGPSKHGWEAARTASFTVRSKSSPCIRSTRDRPLCEEVDLQRRAQWSEAVNAEWDKRRVTHVPWIWIHPVRSARRALRPSAQATSTPTQPQGVSLCGVLVHGCHWVTPCLHNRP